MASKAGSTVAARALGRELRELRLAAKLSTEEVADEISMERKAVWRWETAQTAITIAHLRLLCMIYKASPEMTAALVALAEEAKLRGWWHRYGDLLPSWFELFVSLEAAADHLQQWEPELIPGLLQTRAYAAASLSMGGVTDPADLDRRVNLRVNRQQILTRSDAPARLDVIISEAALRRPIRNRADMADQLRHIVNVSNQLPNVTIKVLTLEAGIHPAARAGAFVIMGFPTWGKYRQPTTVYGESLTGAVFLEQEQEIREYNKVWDAVGSQALGEAETRNLLLKIAEEYQ